MCVIGYDTTENNLECLEKERVTFLMSQKSFNQGYKSVYSIADILILKNDIQKEIFSPVQIIMKENIKYSNSGKSAYITRGKS